MPGYRFIAGFVTKMSLPRGFTDLDKAYNAMPNAFLSVVGVVVDLLPITSTARGQYMQTFKILDPKLRDAVSGSEGLKVRFFKPKKEELPPVEKLGDVVLLKTTKMMPYQGQIMAVSNFQTEVLIIPVDEIPAPASNVGYQDKYRLSARGSVSAKTKFTPEEQSYVVQLSHEMRDTVRWYNSNLKVPVNNATFSPSASVTTGSATTMNASSVDQRPPMHSATTRNISDASSNLPIPKRLKFSNKFKLIGELAHRDFADIIVQVVKKFPANNGITELYVTDYTENQEMFYYIEPEQEDEREREGDTFGYTGAQKRTWPGPYGWLVLKVELYSPHAQYANLKVEEGDFVTMKNVRMKHYHHLEGNMWPDQKNPAEVKIMKITKSALEQPEVVSLQERREKYWTARNVKLGRAGQHGQEKKKPSRTERKKQKKQLQAEKATTAAGVAKAKMIDPISNAQREARSGSSKADINPHVQCVNEEVPIRSIRDILDPANERHNYQAPDGNTHVLPFVNVKSRARVRVVDFEPKKLEDFSVAQKPARNDESDDDTPMMDYESSQNHEWFFSLLLQDASKPKGSTLGPEDQTWVNVHHAEAQYLLGNDVDDPADLHQDHLLLSKLREKLCILWGNLEEKSGDQQLSNRPFECCLSEYGVEMEDDEPERESHSFGWMRMYSLSGVTIR